MNVISCDLLVKQTKIMQKAMIALNHEGNSRAH